MPNLSQVIILSDLKDAHIPYVRRHITGQSVVIDPRDLARDNTLSFQNDARGTMVQFGNVVLNNVTGVWYRKPQPIESDSLPVVPALQDYSRLALERHYALLCGAFPNTTLVNDYYAGLRASNKLLQLQAARKLGFAVAETLITGSKEAAEVFLRRHPNSIVKPLSGHLPRVNGRQALFLTTRIGTSFMPDLSGLHMAPAIFQVAINAKNDIRVTVVGDQVFAASVRSDDGQYAMPVRDSRAGQFDDSIQIDVATHLPSAIKRLCIEHTKAMGLTFGAIDLIEDHEGVFWFIENNAGGQWAYIEEATGLLIGAAIARLLMQKSN
jgi:glutathione synthase/RimK-type ligase-like ATP-grasp enzyme